MSSLDPGYKQKSVLFLWSQRYGYAEACWRMLAAASTYNITVVTIEGGINKQSDIQFSNSLPSSVDWIGVSFSDAQSLPNMLQCLGGRRFDLVVMSGWRYGGYTKLLSHSFFKETPYFLVSDNPWKRSVRQRLGRYVLAGLLKRAARIFVPGERGFQLMRSWGVPSQKIRKILYGIEAEGLGRSFEARTGGDWPRNFAYVGRLDTRKGVDLLCNAYSSYRNRVNSPWGLHIYGRGPLAETVNRCPGVSYRGIVQPEALPLEYEACGAFVICSRSDAWPLALVEAAAAGLPIICTAECGSSVEVVRHGYNGYITAADSSDIATGLQYVASLNDESLRIMGARSRQLSAPYSANEWALNWCREIESTIGK